MKHAWNQVFTNTTNVDIFLHKILCAMLMENISFYNHFLAAKNVTTLISSQLHQMTL